MADFNCNLFVQDMLYCNIPTRNDDTENLIPKSYSKWVEVSIFLKPFNYASLKIWFSVLEFMYYNWIFFFSVLVFQVSIVLMMNRSFWNMNFCTNTYVPPSSNHPRLSAMRWRLLQPVHFTTTTPLEYATLEIVLDILVAQTLHVKDRRYLWLSSIFPTAGLASFPLDESAKVFEQNKLLLLLIHLWLAMGL